MIQLRQLPIFGFPTALPEFHGVVAIEPRLINYEVTPGSIHNGAPANIAALSGIRKSYSSFYHRDVA